SRRRHTRFSRDWSSDVCSSDLIGISALIYKSAFAFTIVKYGGAAYLLYLAYKSFRDNGSSLQLKNEDNLSYKSLYKKGVIMNLLNTKVSLFFLAFFPQFINYDMGLISMQMLIYGILFLLQALFIFSLISIFAGKAGYYLRKNPTISRKMNVLQGILFTLIGLNIAFSEK